MITITEKTTSFIEAIRDVLPPAFRILPLGKYVQDLEEPVREDALTVDVARTDDWIQLTCTKPGMGLVVLVRPDTSSYSITYLTPPAE